MGRPCDRRAFRDELQIARGRAQQLLGRNYAVLPLSAFVDSVALTNLLDYDYAEYDNGFLGRLLENADESEDRTGEDIMQDGLAEFACFVKRPLIIDSKSLQGGRAFWDAFAEKVLTDPCDPRHANAIEGMGKSTIHSKTHLANQFFATSTLISFDIRVYYIMWKFV